MDSSAFCLLSFVVVVVVVVGIFIYLFIFIVSICLIVLTIAKYVIRSKGINVWKGTYCYREYCCLVDKI